MPILQSCCCWNSVRKGSYFCATFSLIFFGIFSYFLYQLLCDEKEFLAGISSTPKSQSFLHNGVITEGSLIFSMMFLASSILIVFGAVALLFGLKMKKPSLFLPWICFMLCNNLIEFAHLIYLSIKNNATFNPVVGFIFTLDFFIICIDAYCLLCVISHYQELMLEQSRQRIEADEGIVLNFMPNNRNPLLRTPRPFDGVNFIPLLNVPPNNEIERRADVFSEVIIETDADRRPDPKRISFREPNDGMTQSVAYETP